MKINHAFATPKTNPIKPNFKPSPSPPQKHPNFYEFFTIFTNFCARLARLVRHLSAAADFRIRRGGQPDVVSDTSGVVTGCLEPGVVPENSKLVFS